MRTFVLVVVLAGCGAHMSDGNGVGSGSGSGSGSDMSCEGGLVLDPSSGQCVECVPGDPGACPSGQYCRPDNVCVAGCSVDNDCSMNESSQCNAPIYPNFCANTTVYVIHDGITADQNAADLMASTITANCPSTVMVHTANQTDASLVDQTTGQPLAGAGVTYVFGGGPFANKPIKWLEQTQLATKVYFSAPDGVNYDWMVRNVATPVASMPAATCSTHLDQFVTELVTDPMSGTLSLVGYGACTGGQGTLAAAYFYANVILPNTAMYPDSWYVFSWSDTNNNATPDAGDTFTVQAHGL
jgi:hypothetical protein